MTGTAADNLRHQGAITSRFTDVSFTTSAKPESVGTILLSEVVTIVEAGPEAAPTASSDEGDFKTVFELGRKDYEQFVQTLIAPPEPSKKLIDLWRDNLG